MTRIELNTLQFALDHTDKTLVLIDDLSKKKYQLLGGGTSSESSVMTFYIEEVEDDYTNIR